MSVYVVQLMIFDDFCGSFLSGPFLGKIGFSLITWIRLDRTYSITDYNNRFGTMPS